MLAPHRLRARRHARTGGTDVVHARQPGERLQRHVLGRDACSGNEQCEACGVQGRCCTSTGDAALTELVLQLAAGGVLDATGIYYLPLAGHVQRVAAARVGPDEGERDLGARALLQHQLALRREQEDRKGAVQHARLDVAPDVRCSGGSRGDGGGVEVGAYATCKLRGAAWARGSHGRVAARTHSLSCCRCRWARRSSR